MNAVVSERKEVRFAPNAERNGRLEVESSTGSYIDAYVYAVRKVRGVPHLSMLAAAHGSLRDCCVFHSLPRTTPSGYVWSERWSLRVCGASFSLTKSEADRLIAEFGFKLEESRL